MSFDPDDPDTNALLYEILVALKTSQSRMGFPDAAGNQRVSGSVSATCTGTLTAVTGQTNIGGYSASMQVMSTMNANAQRVYALIGRS